MTQSVPPTAQMLPDDAAAAKAARQRRRRRRRIARAVVLCSLGLLIGAWFLVTRSPLTGAVVLPKLEAALGARVEAEAVTISLDGRIILKRARFLAPGVAGPAGRVFEVARLDAEVGWGALLSGTPSVRNLTLIEPVLRVSQSTEDQSINIAKFHVPQTDRPAGEIPTITVERGAIELGEHTGGAYTPLKRIGINGRLRPTLEAGAYVIDLRQVEGGGAGFDLRGVLSQKEISLTLRGLTLDDWTPESVPSPVRGIFSLLAMKGEIAETTFDYEFAGGMEATIALKNVALNLPVTEGGEVANPSAPGPAMLMRMQDVNGVVTFDGRGVRAAGAGVLEDLPYQLNLSYTGLSVDSPFTCELVSRDFQISENPQIVRFAPPVVRERLQNFSNPTGIVNSLVKFSRTERAGPVKVEGQLNFRETTAAFHKFPYRFSNLSGAVRFDADRIDILEVKGSAPSGAKITASGAIYPPTSEAYANIKVHVEDVPIDETLKEAMGAGRRRILDVIFNEERYAALLAEGLVRRPGEAGGRAGAPEFAMGGRAAIDVTVIRDAGPGSNWHEEIDVRLPQAALVPEPFPLPILADEVSISVRNDVARVVGGRYRGLRGGLATLEAETDLTRIKEPDAEIVPKVRITAREVPVDDLLVRATPGPREGDGPGALSAREVLRQLHVEGTVNCEARIDARADGRLGYDIDVEVPGVTARARSSDEAAAPFIMEDARGRIHVSESKLEMDLAARAPGAQLPEAAAAPGEGASVQGRGQVELTHDAAGSGAIDISVRCAGLDLAAPIEEVIGIFSKETAQRVLDLRREHKPEGRVEAAVHVARPYLVGTGAPGPAPAPTVQVELTGGRDLAMDAAGGRVGLARAGGVARVIADGRPRAVFEQFGGPAVVNGEACGTATATGWIELPGMSDGPAGERGADLSVDVRGARFESPPAAWVAREKIGGGLGAFYDQSRPRGEFDALLKVTPARGPAAQGWNIDGSIAPQRLTFERNGAVIAIDQMAGRVEFTRDSGRLVGLSGHAPRWNWSADGSWVMEEPGRPTLQAKVNLDSVGLGNDLKALLPIATAAALDEIKFGLDGRLRAEGMTIKWTPGEESAGGDASSAYGRLELQDASLEAGLPVSDATGTVDFGVEREPGRAAKFELVAIMDAFRLAGVEMTGGRVKVAGGDPEGEVLLPLITADCHRGRLTGQARVREVEGVRRYEAEIGLAGVQFGPVLRDLAEYSRETSPEAPQAAEQVASARPEPESASGQRGTLDAQVSLAGIVGQEASRRGRGEARVYGGRVVNYPLLMRLIRVSNLQLPVNDTLELARASFYIDSGTVTFEDVSVSAGSVEILGFGTVSWPGLEADMRFNSRAVRRVPVVSDVLEAVRDELITTRVTGKVSDPDVRMAGFSGTRKFLSRLLGGEVSEQDRKLAEIEARARRERERARNAGIAPARVGE